MSKKKNNNKRINSIKCIILFVVSIIYTILIKFIDVQPIGPNNSKVGFASLNKEFASSIGVNMKLYKISEYLGYITFVIVFMYAFIGLIQLIKRKKLQSVDKEIILLGFFYIALGIIYIIFEKFIINYRPVLINNVLKSSYPSSHTILALCTCGSSILASRKIFNNGKAIKLLNITSFCLMIGIIICRSLSGVHWLTDIIGGLIFSVTLLKIFATLIDNE